MPSAQEYPASINLLERSGPSPGDKLIKLLLAGLGLYFALEFTRWLLDLKVAGYPPLYFLILISFLYFILRLLLEWYFTLFISVPRLPALKKTFTVDVLTTYCAGEPREMVINTLKAIVKLNYPNRAYLCDEENDPELKKVCKKLGVTHVTRAAKVDAKAGNINNALRTVAKGELCLILDPDHVPHPEFLNKVIPYFKDDKIGYVQTVQAYYNQEHTIIARAAAQQSYQFYGPIMMGLNSLGTVPAIGANCVFRRSALDSIGGHAPGLTEDMHTSILLHAKGWKSLYVPILASKGLVPWNFSGYCAQQLKWSRGTFDLLFKVLPGKIHRLSFHQIMYYLSAGIFYLYGLKGLLDILIPVLALLLVAVPLRVDILEFFQHFLPLAIIMHVIRQFNQRWLFEEHEKGLHLKGGILLKSTWWIALTGLFYTLINKKVPYIPTPKDFSHETPWRLFVPNVLAIVLSIVAIVMGLRADFTPYSLFMAFIAFWNIVILSVGTAMGMQKQIVWLHQTFHYTLINKQSKTRQWLNRSQTSFYHRLQTASFPLLSIALLLVFVRIASISYSNTRRLNRDNPIEKNFGPVYVGAELDKGVVEIPVINTGNSTMTGIVMIDSDIQSMRSGYLMQQVGNILQRNYIPYIQLRHDYLHPDLDSITACDIQGLVNILKGGFHPLYLGIKRTPCDTTECPDEEERYYRSLLHLATLFGAQGAGNITWVWDLNLNSDEIYLSGSRDFVAWVSLDSEDIQPRQLKSLIDSPSFPTDFPILLRYTSPEKADPGAEKALDELRSRVPALAIIGRDWSKLPGSPVSGLAYAKLVRYTEKAHSNGQPGRLPVQPQTGWLNHEAFYIRGIAYNPGHDWQDNRFNLPLTSEKLDQDFSAIAAMGGNLIRRYSPSIFDYNILRYSEKHGLKILYGFWFDPKINYATDRKALDRYRSEVVRRVTKYRDREVIYGWSIGNETWGLLKHHYGEPYLSQVRKQYLEFIESLAQEIRQIDPERPLFAMEEHSPLLPTALASFCRFVPTVDVIGINSYYTQNLEILDSLVTVHYPGKPYIVSEFGPKGYWYKPYTDYRDDSILLEPGSYQKAREYQENWTRHVERYRAKNLGGVAFCWQDRFEGTATWFGLTDVHGNKKPGYYALKEIWTGTPAGYAMPEFSITITGLDSSDRKPLVLHARTAAELYTSELEYKWMIYEEGSYQKVLESDYSRFDTLAVRRPRRPSSYRAYLYVADNKSNVVTASAPFNTFSHE
jgi:cellulose synthase (UDP-forming)